MLRRRRAFISTLFAIAAAQQTRDGQDCILGGQGRRLAFILFLPTQYALDLQLLGGLWILQTFPALVFGLFTRWFRAEGVLLGWVAGIGWGSWTAWSNGLKPLATIGIGGASYVFYVGLGALILNAAVAVLATAVLAPLPPQARP